MKQLKLKGPHILDMSKMCGLILLSSLTKAPVSLCAILTNIVNIISFNYTTYLSKYRVTAQYGAVTLIFISNISKNSSSCFSVLLFDGFPEIPKIFHATYTTQHFICLFFFNHFRIQTLILSLFF